MEIEKRKVLVGSKNPVKIEATKEAFSKLFTNIKVNGGDVKSGVPRQPLNDQIFLGAKNRVAELKQIDTADFFVGIEGGAIKLDSRWFSCGVVYIENKEGQSGHGVSPMFEIPKSFLKEIQQGVELSHIIDRISGDKNCKEKGGAVGFLTNGILDRKQLYTSAIITALVPILNRKLY